MAKNINTQLLELKLQLEALDSKVRKRVMRSANRKGINVAKDAATSIALQRFHGEGFMASQIAVASGRGTPTKIVHRLGVGGGARAPKAGTYRASKTPLKRRGKEKRTGLTGFGGDGAAYYWRFLEFGTSKMPARPFLRPAFEANLGRMISVVTIETKKGIDRAAKKLKKLGRA